MSTRLDYALVAVALFSWGVASGAVMVNVIGPEPEVIVKTRTVVKTVKVTVPPKPPKTITVTRVVERASRSVDRSGGYTDLAPWQRAYWDRAQTWAATPKAQAVIACESSGNPRAVSRTGKFRGLWQMDAAFWASYGGLDLAPRPDLAPAAAQHYVAYRGFVSRRWTPWECA